MDITEKDGAVIFKMANYDILRDCLTIIDNYFLNNPYDIGYLYSHDNKTIYTIERCNMNMAKALRYNH